MIGSLSKYFWEEGRSNEPEAVRRLTDHFEIPNAAARFLISRDYATPDKATAYLNVERIPEHDPFLFENMERAVASVGAAIQDEKSILIHGDYDVDGICGTAILYEYLRGQAPHVSRFLPDRRKDGYGVAERAVQ